MGHIALPKNLLIPLLTRARIRAYHASMSTDWSGVMDRASMTEVGERAYRALKLENGNRDARALLLTEHHQAAMDSALAHEREHARMDELEGAIPAGMGVSCSRCSLRYDVPPEPDPTGLAAMDRSAAEREMCE